MNQVMNRIDTMFNSLPEDISGLNEEQLRQVLLSLKVDQYKEQANSQIKASKFDLNEKIDLWLLGKAKDSQRMYRLYLNDFVSYLDDIHILNVSSFIADKYIREELVNNSVAKVKLSMSAVSSFYSALVRWGDVSLNPFYGIKVKAPTTFTKKYIPSNEDVLKILNSFKDTSNSGRKMRIAIYILYRYGVRIGFLDGKNVQYDGEYLTSTSKGKYYRVYAPNDLVLEASKEILLEMNPNSIASAFNRAVGKLFASGVLGVKYSPHDLRHTFACREYRKSKDIYRVSKLMNHAGVGVTEYYLKGLGVL